MVTPVEPRATPAEPQVAPRTDLDRLRSLAISERLMPVFLSDAEQRRAHDLAALCPGAEPWRAAKRLGVSFFRALRDHAQRSMRFYRPGARTLSADEPWLLRLVERCALDDSDSAYALISGRIAESGRGHAYRAACALPDALKTLAKSPQSII